MKLKVCGMCGKPAAFKLARERVTKSGKRQDWSRYYCSRHGHGMMNLFPGTLLTNYPKP